jgi:diacylglycerol kinase family enzyme
MMRASAILGPGAKESDLAPFRGPEIQFTDELKQADAVVVLGGDGTVHRHLPVLVEAQRPVLVVPHGSGNDFARALGISSPRQALAVWSAFQENKARVR